MIHAGGGPVPLPGLPSIEPKRSLRDYFAAHALIGFLSNPARVPPNDGTQRQPEFMASAFSAASYIVADAMLKERAK